MQITSISDLVKEVCAGLDTDQLKTFLFYSPFDKSSNRVVDFIRKRRDDIHYVSFWDVPAANKILEFYPPIDGKYRVAFQNSPVLVIHRRDRIVILPYKEEIYAALGL